MTITGTVEHIIFRGIDTGYAVLELKTSTGLVTASGKFPLVGEGEKITAEGNFTQTKYGQQFVADKVEIEKPTSKEQLIRYLSSGLISGC